MIMNRPLGDILSSVFLLYLMLCPLRSFAQITMVHPDIDRPDEPFSYFSRPTDVIGVMDGPEGTMIDPDGNLATGFGTMVFFTGKERTPVHQRLRTLLDGYLPIIKYYFNRDGIRYEVTAFAFTLDGKPESPLMNIVRVNITNITLKQQTAWWSAGTRYDNPLTRTNKFPVVTQKPGDYLQAGVPFNSNWKYRFSGHALLRNNKVMFLYPESPEPQEIATRASAGPIDSASVFGVVQYRLDLQPGQSKTLIFRMPYTPFPSKSSLREKLQNADFDTYLNRTLTFWNQLFERGINITLPEEKVNDTFRASLVYDLIARDKIKGHYIQKVNEFQYDRFWLRDASYILRMYDLSGYHDLARQVLSIYDRWQNDDGNFVSQPGQYDGWGEAVWAYSQHFRITRDTALAQQNYPAIKKAFHWLQQARNSDPLHLLPAVNPNDNERVRGHITGQNFWALGGLKNAIQMTQALGYSDDANAMQNEFDNYYKSVKSRIDSFATKTHGYIQPALDRNGGQDWGNMLSVFPTILLNPNDYHVTSTLINTRNKYQEGLMTYSMRNVRYLHHYLTLHNSETELIQNRQKMVIEDLYNVLTHTSSTQAGFETLIIPWSDRDPGWDMTPHGWFAAEYRTIIRNMMIREQGNVLHLLSAVSPEWIGPGKQIKVLHAPTYFGHVSFELRCEPDSAEITFDANYFKGLSPDTLALHLPWFMYTDSVIANGQPQTVTNGVVNLLPNVSKIEIKWHRIPSASRMSYKKAVKDYIEEYRKRYYQLHPGTE